MMQNTACTGCGVCFDICPKKCIEMVPDNEGFLYPYVDKKNCIQCNICKQVCPAFNKRSSKNVSEEQKSFVAWNKNIHIRNSSTSGGIFSALADKTISEGGVVVGAAFDDSYHLKHIVAHNSLEWVPMIGSKYLQSDTRGIFRQVKELLNNGVNVLFTGTACQIAGLHSFLDRDYDGLLTCEVICHGVPSPGLYKDYLLHLEKKIRCKVSDYQFRSKKYGWDKLAVSVKYANQKTKTYRARYCPFHNWFGKHLSVRPSCFKCYYRGTNRDADITLGDFWGIENYLSDVDISSGVSVILTNTTKGIKQLKDMKVMLHFEHCPIDWVLGKNPCLTKNYPVPKDRENFFYDYRRLPMKELIKKYPPENHFKLIIGKICRLMRMR